VLRRWRGKESSGTTECTSSTKNRTPRKFSPDKHILLFFFFQEIPIWTLSSRFEFPGQHFCNFFHILSFVCMWHSYTTLRLFSTFHVFSLTESCLEMRESWWSFRDEQNVKTWVCFASHANTRWKHNFPQVIPLTCPYPVLRRKILQKS